MEEEQVAKLTSGVIPTWIKRGLISIPPPIPKTPPRTPASSAIIGKISFPEGPCLVSLVPSCF